VLNRTPVTHAAAKQIQAMILDGSLAPGQQIPSQRELAVTLKLSRASLREALLTLEAIGLIVTQPGRGTFVAEVSPNGRTMTAWRHGDYSVKDVFETRIMLESQIVRLGAAAVTAGQIEELTRLTDQMERAWAAGDLLGNAEADFEFHGIIVSVCPNRMLVDLYAANRDRIHSTQIQPIAVTDPARMRSSIAEHRLIVAALREGDANRAAETIAIHIANTARCAGIAM
jgi:GntR family transcriptional repressor for pyruvate dehydrogenase complex